jgi:hypothetical protein
MRVTIHKAMAIPAPRPTRVALLDHFPGGCRQFGPYLLNCDHEDVDRFLSARHDPRLTMVAPKSGIRGGLCTDCEISHDVDSGGLSLPTTLIDTGTDI